MAKAQLEHVFVFLMMAFLAGFTLLIGYKYLGALFTDTCGVEQAQFVRELERTIERAKDYGSVRTVEVPAPCNAQRLCFADASRFGVVGANGVLTGNFNSSACPASIATPKTVMRLPNPLFRSSSITSAGYYRCQREDRRLNASYPRIVEMAFRPSTPPAAIFLITERNATVPLPLSAMELRVQNPQQALCLDASGGEFSFVLRGEGRAALVNAT